MILSATRSMILGSLAFVACLLLSLPGSAVARPLVRSIRSAHEFDRLLEKHSKETGLPVVVDFYSDGCGPCRMMAPIYKKVAKEFLDKAVFVKIDTNAQHELSGRYRIQSLPTFQWYVGGRKIEEQKGGIGEGPLRQTTQKAVRQAETENVKLELEDLKAFYAEVDASKPEADIESVYSKCKGKKEFCQGSIANTLAYKLKKKYKKKPETQKLFVPVPKKDDGDEKSSSSSKPTNNQNSQQKPKPNAKQSSNTKSNTPNLHLATKEQLLAELEKRQDEERDDEVEGEDIEEEDSLEDNASRWIRGSFPEKVIIIGGGPAGMASAIYAARAGLSPMIIAPAMGGQLQGKGVDVENYPGLHNFTGPAVIASMRSQAATFGAVFEDDFVTKIDASSRPLKVFGNSTGVIEAHSIIVATGADSKWLGIPGEFELRGGGVSSCATCDGFLFSGRHVVVIGGGDTAMEDALVLARTSKKVTMIHRRDSFRASKVLADRVKNHPLIEIQWNTVLEKIEGKPISTPDNDSNDDDDADEMDLDDVSATATDTTEKIVSAAVLKDVVTGEIRTLSCDAVFVAIGHSPNTGFLDGVVEFHSDHPGYVQTIGTSTKTSVPGIYAAGDVSDAVYRQAITSAGSGAAAALDAERFLSEEGLGNEEAEMEAELLRELASEMNDASNQSDMGYNAYEDAGGRVHGVKESLGAEL
uniref:Thioredoxin domain-containing protein n=1 Tax=Pseudo-nitzschia australis TaxID=44445 RepID=A0A7S4AM73_9STRA|mmetsp:Transcript_20932/g.44153  ORF Transcript_20932/g.44153 Transcript_20932/m.44153 type:complete len:698 (+) Transcript_20932:199-2292(+)|eukprot:CAMPEP_0168180308 /NCGR_PEP_ID=MMETSP0139_2-20121125/10436_1 /TAXON_ID=44445 /ORGANISM="Pseudo-nitzschia australis, Strain 10249 10 AB" /LENGTH=697 /DNA_ID=CAMNT_0008100453 /DNA_START=137 /DNA_END=2230 /DNA_ORIENTATION=+